MNRASRTTLILYGLCLAYCFVWIPWRNPPFGHDDYLRLGYGFLWVGPRDAPFYYESFAVPDMPLIALRVFAVTSVAIASLALMWRHDC
jgi:hypothetical protein